jgi:hypothetical protein
MPRYFFHLRDHTERLIDPQGQMIDNPEAIAEAALFEARSILSHEVLSGSMNLDQRIEVEDRAGNVVHTLNFRDAVTIRD